MLHYFSNSVIILLIVSWNYLQINIKQLVLEHIFFCNNEFSLHIVTYNRYKRKDILLNYPYTFLAPSSIRECRCG